MNTFNKSNNWLQRLNQAGSTVSKARARLNVAQERLEGLKHQAARWEAELSAREQARAILQEVARKAQERLAIHLGGTVSLALTTVFDAPYSLRCEFTPRRGRTECDLIFERNGERFDPLTEAGGAPVDVASFALRVAVWSLSPTRPVLVLDEPFRFVGEALHERCSRLLREVSHRMGLQIIAVTHDAPLAEAADRVFVVENVGGVANVTANTAN